MVYPNLFELIKLIIYCHWNQFQKSALPPIGNIGKGGYYYINDIIFDEGYSNLMGLHVLIKFMVSCEVQ